MELLILGAIVYLVATNFSNPTASGSNSNLSIANGNTFNDLVKLANAKNFTVTSTTGGTHNTGSKHAKGLAIDVRTSDKTAAEITDFIYYVQNFGVKVRDERIKPANQKIWNGAHLHLELV